MDVDENVFFREATAYLQQPRHRNGLKRCFEYIGAFIPVTRAPCIQWIMIWICCNSWHQSVATTRRDERVLPLPEKGRNKRAADLQAALVKNEV